MSFGISHQPLVITGFCMPYGIIQTAVEQHIPVRVVFLTYGDNNQ